MTDQRRKRYLALPPSGKGPGVLVFHAWWGVNGFIKSFCDRLAREGFVALAPDLYHGKVARAIEAAEYLRDEMDMEQAASEVLAAASDLSQHPAVAGAGLGMVGFSLGAYWALWLAQQQPAAFRAVTVFYGTRPGDYQASGAAFQGHFAENDPFEAASDVQRLEESLKAAHRPTCFYTYPGTGHWFFESDRQDAYAAPAAQLAWDRTAAFLHDYLYPQE